jgi:hypothetical protein
VRDVANSEHFSIYWNASIAHAAHAMISTRSMEPKTAFAAAIGAAAAQVLPYHPLGAFCRGPFHGQPDTLATCRRLSGVLRHGDTYLSEMLGLALAKRIWPEGSAEYRAIVAAQRLARYRTDANDHLMTRRPMGNADAERYLELMATHDTEQAAVLASITAAGVNPDPAQDRKWRWR